MIEITKSKSKWGTAIIVFACLVFFGLYWYLLLEPIQNSYVTKNLLNKTANHPSWVLFFLIGAIVGFLFGATTMIGFNIGKPSFFNIDYPDGLHLHDIIISKSFWIWSICWAGAYILFTMFWIGGI